MQSGLAHFLASRIPIERVVGLRPRTWICVGGGFGREEVKTLILDRGGSFVAEAVTSLQDTAHRLIVATRAVSGDPASGGGRLIGPLARQEILRALIAEPRITKNLPELKRLRRQNGFYRRLDLALQSARMAFAHEDEEAVFCERLIQRLGESAQRPVRDELRLLTAAYEAWLKGTSCWDPPMLYREAIAILDRGGWPEALRKPEEILVFSNTAPDSLERAFCEALAREVRVERINAAVPDVGAGAEALGAGSESRAPSASFRWSRWHTLDDAVEELADELASIESADELAQNVVLIPDLPAVRRSLQRALRDRGIPQADPRDPMRIRWDESLKWASLPLEVVARDFERAKVISWLKAYQDQPEFPAWAAEINSRGIRQGLGFYASGMLAGVHSRLVELAEGLAGRKTCAEIGEFHLKLLRVHAGDADEREWVVRFFEAFWREFIEDMASIGLADRKAPILFWFERYQSRLAETPAPVEALKPERGLAVYRIHQVPLVSFKKVWVLGMPPSWLGGEGAGDLWFTEREREILGSEFGVRSAIEMRRERVAAFTAWVRESEQVVFLDSAYEFDGRERESLEPTLQDLWLEWKLLIESKPEPEDRGSHPRWIKGFGALRPTPPQEVRLPKRLPVRLQEGRSEITATMLDRYSRCSFQGLAFHRWKLRDTREPDSELWPEVKGNILHQAVLHLIQARDSAGHFSISPMEALERAWTEKPPKGLFKSKRVENYVKSRMLKVLETFCAKERDYVSRAGTRPLILDDVQMRLDLEVGGEMISIIGKPDRIDEAEEGLLVIDYKTSSASPNGTDMLESGYRLQLPFYALAAAKHFGRRVLGVQFVELTSEGSRTSGMFFGGTNGKDPGNLTNLRSNSKSLLKGEPEEAWARMQASIEAQAQAMLSGVYDAQPRLPQREKECNTCSLSDLCGLKRLSATGSTVAQLEGASE